MGNKGWIKRVLPFFAAFAVGVFIASLFGFGGPRFGRPGRWRMHQEMDRLRTENEELRNENLRLRNGCDSHDQDFDVYPAYPIDVAPPPPVAMPHHPPPMPHRPPRHSW